jgi:hypothetical protein
MWLCTQLRGRRFFGVVSGHEVVEAALHGQAGIATSFFQPVSNLLNAPAQTHPQDQEVLPLCQ